MTKVFIVMGHIGDCSEPYYVASTLSKAKSWINKKAKEESKDDPHMKSYYKVGSLWALERTKMENGFRNKQNSTANIRIEISFDLVMPSRCLKNKFSNCSSSANAYRHL